MVRTQVGLLAAALLTAALPLAGCATRPGQGPATDELPAAPFPRGLATVPLRVGLEVVADPRLDPVGLPFGSLAAPAAEIDLGPTSDPTSPTPPQPIRVTFERPERPPSDEVDGLGFVQHALPWHFDDESLSRMGDRREQVVLRFVDDLLGADRRRLQHHLGAPVVLTRLSQSRLPALQTAFDERLADDQASHDHRVLQSLLRKPLRRAAVRLSILDDFQAEIEAFKRGNVPLSAEYQEVHGGPGLGRVSMRVRPSRLEDPIELTWVNSGLRLGTSQEYLKLRYTWRCAPDTFASVSWHSPYDHRDDHLAASLEWRPEPDLRLNISISDRMQFLDGPTAWTGASSPIDGDGGVLFYVEQLF